MNLQLSHVYKSFGGQEVLRDVSFMINKDDRVGLLGRNGCGKTTLLKIVIGQELPDEGYVSINPKTAKIGYLPQVLDEDGLLSSGQLLKKILREVMRTNPDMLCLDEPTNHLDRSGRQWLEREITDFSGPVLIVSHDREFLDKNVDKILELSDGEVKVYGGNYSFYKQQKLIEADAMGRRYAEQQKRLGKLEDRAVVVKNRTQQLEMSTTGSDHYVRRKAAKAAKSALAMERRINKELSEDRIDKPESNWDLKAIFRLKRESGRTVVLLKSVKYRQILDNVSLTISRGQRVALMGDNGSGKTTLIRLILGELVPEAGEIVFGNGVEMGYLSQKHEELNSDKIVLDELMSEYVDKTESYKLLRRFLLTPEKINQPVNLLSSGEKAKLLLAKIMTSGANFIILDEPTNHLDIPSREAVEGALVNYDGTLLVVSHDRYFLKNIGIDNFYMMEKGKVVEQADFNIK